MSVKLTALNKLNDIIDHDFADLVFVEHTLHIDVFC